MTSRVFAFGQSVASRFPRLPTIRGRQPFLLLPGSFAPAHDGHVAMLKHACAQAQASGLHVSPATSFFELSISNAEKGTVRDAEILTRAEAAAVLLPEEFGGIILSDLPLFAEKAASYPKGCCFAIGSDTAVRILMEKYGWNKDMDNLFLGRSSRFFVFHRKMEFIDSLNAMLLENIDVVSHEKAREIRSLFLPTTRTASTAARAAAFTDSKRVKVVEFEDGMSILKDAISGKILPQAAVEVDDGYYDSSGYPAYFSFVDWEGSSEASRKQRFIDFIRSAFAPYNAFRDSVLENNCLWTNIGYTDPSRGISVTSKNEGPGSSHSLLQALESYSGSVNFKGPTNGSEEEGIKCHNIRLTIEWKNGATWMDVSEIDVAVVFYAQHDQAFKKQEYFLPRVPRLLGLDFEKEREDLRQVIFPMLVENFVQKFSKSLFERS
uniref:Cytidyltransferase-like domain-containing protein n=1 Tax=Palpitomonas bilix TaxID=652834 RepID=A0A7S3LTE8_9EUKA|mmetsp:Transcript_45141/g.116779  ORF Transcript_45141/g.116779 Transcript_45141/m.116779 type:complete len:436 (+) Transcript_45141:67-1374(+)